MRREAVLKVKASFDKIRAVGVLGWGRSGRSAAYLAGKALGKKIVISTAQSNLSDKEWELAYALGAEIEWGGHSRNFLRKAPFWVVSPGLKPSADALKILDNLGIPWVGEVEFASWFCRAPIIAVTGTNGKSTTAAKISYMFNLAGKKNFFLGNIGQPFSQAVMNIASSDWVILEVSSFQLSRTFTFRPFVACWLNFSPNHLNWHRNMEEYFLAKKKIFANQRKSDHAFFLSSLSPRLADIAAEAHVLEEGADSSGFTAAVGREIGFPETVIRSALASFKGLPHRLELVRNVGGVDFINDSKSTTVDSTIWALKKIRGGVILISGGQDKGLDYSRINPYLKNVRKIFLIGSARKKIAASLAAEVAWEYKDSLEEAVVSAYKTARKGESVLLSPMCASFDSFSSFEERGNVFRKKVYQLPV